MFIVRTGGLKSAWQLLFAPPTARGPTDQETLLRIAPADSRLFEALCAGLQPSRTVQRRH